MNVSGHVTSVDKWILKNVPYLLESKFKKHMIRWDNSLRRLPISYWPSYDEDVLITALRYAEEE